MLYGKPAFVPDNPDLPVSDYFLFDEAEREAALTWANGVFADLAHYPDLVGLVACKVLVACRAERMSAAEMLIQILEKSVDRAA